jgi:MFS family permease
VLGSQHRAFLTGADVAWITDELDQPQRIARVLTTSARRDLAGGATGMVVFGVLGWATSLATAIAVSGASICSSAAGFVALRIVEARLDGVGVAWRVYALTCFIGMLGLFVAARFTERNFLPTREQRWSASLSIFRLGVSLARRDHEVLLVFVATMLINGAALVGWLFPRQLVNLGFPSDPVLWYMAFGICSSAAGFVALRIVEARLDGVGVARRVYALTCFIGMLGLVVLAVAPDALIGGAGVLLVSGIAFNVTRTVSVIWVNRRTTSDVRATVHSFLD